MSKKADIKEIQEKEPNNINTIAEILHQKGVEVLDSNPKLRTVYVTLDGRVHTTLADAEAAAGEQSFITVKKTKDNE